MEHVTNREKDSYLAVKKPKVAFVIPVLNGERDLSRCLASIQALSSLQDRHEVIVMDNGSTDRTTQIVRELGFDYCVIPNVHVSSLRNEGVARTRGEFVAFIDADVELAPGWLERGLAVFDDPQVVAAGCFPGVPAEGTWVQKTWDIHQRGRRCGETPTTISWLPSMNLIVRRQDFLAVSGFNEQLRTVEDVDLCYRIAQRGTILWNPGMEAIHWGEARDLRTFWRKESWRSSSNFNGLFSHGLCWDELPSLGYPLYVLAGVILFGLGGVIDLLYKQFLLIPLGLTMLVLPAAALAVNTARLSNQSSHIFELFVLYLTYGLARACAIIRALIGSSRRL